MTDEAPKRIWAQDADPSECDEYIGGGWWDDECGKTQYPDTVEYIRADHALAIVAEAYGVAANVPMDRLSDGKSVAPINIAVEIQAKTPADAQAARDALIAETRRKALEEAAAKIDRKIKAVQPEMSRRAQRLAEGKKPGFQYAIHRADLDARMSDRDAILALIEKDKTNE